jgi:hypothetical protein
MKSVWIVYEECMGNVWGMYEVCIRYVSHMHIPVYGECITYTYILPIISLSEVSLMYALCIPQVCLMYPLCIMATCLHKMTNMAIMAKMDLFGNNGKKQQSQRAFFGRRYYRVIFLSCHLFMLNRDNKIIFLKLSLSVVSTPGKI